MLRSPSGIGTKMVELVSLAVSAAFSHYISIILIVFYYLFGNIFII